MSERHYRQGCSVIGALLSSYYFNFNLILADGLIKLKQI